MMTLPKLAPIGNLPITLPPIKDNQAWAFNQDTSPPSLVLIEFIYNVNESTSSGSQDAINLLNTTINQTLTNITTELSSLSSRLTTLESLINTASFNINPQGILSTEPN